MSPPANGEASFSVSVTTPEDIEPGDTVRIVVSVVVNEQVLAKMRRQLRETDCKLNMALNGETVYDQTLATTDGGTKELTSGPVKATENPTIEVTQKCGEKPVDLTVGDVTLAGESSAGQGDPTTTDSAAGGSETGGSSSKGSGGSATSGKPSQTGNISSTNKPAICIASFIAGLIALFA